MRATFFIFFFFAVISSACGGSSPPTGSDAEPTPDAFVPECENGDMRTGPCGNCGMGQQVCEEGRWTLTSPCFDQGECPAGTIETESLPLCGEQQRLCYEDCSWGGWAVTAPSDGDCEPGDDRFDEEGCTPGFVQRDTCSDQCVWVADAAGCVEGCGEPPRVTANEDEEEACVPAGVFVRGLAGLADAEPVAEVTLTQPYFVDRYVVTNRRYKACYDAGVCAAVYMGDALADLQDPSRAEYPVWGVFSREDAETFCAWDGGRRLLTEAEWEKAARGPAPRMNKYTWDGDLWRCDLLQVIGCPGYVSPGAADPSDLFEPYQANPGDVSYYGVRGMLGAVWQWVKDYYDPAYYSLPESLVDPQGPPTCVGACAPACNPVCVLIVHRGNNRHGQYMDTSNLSQRWPSTGLDGIRCGRTALGP